MFRYDTLREQWLIITLFFGLAFVLFYIIISNDINRPREKKKDKPDEFRTEYLSVWQGIPWSVKIVVVVLFISMLTYQIVHIIHPNSW